MAYTRSSKTMSDVLDLLRNKILYLELKPGVAILDTSLAEELEVSRTPVREAFLILQYENLINIYPQKGTFVSKLDLNYIRETVYIRHVLECNILQSLVAAKASVRERVSRYLYLQELAVREGNQRDYVLNDHLFHKELFDIAGHRSAWELIESQCQHATRFHMLDFIDSKDVLHTSLLEHRELVRLIEDRALTKAQELLAVHHDCELRTAEELTKKYADFFVNKSPSPSR